MAELCLGTVQFGMEYGINNTQGQPSWNDSVEMLKYAIDNGIKYIDTARAYGEAELVIGEYIKRYGMPEDVKLISKLRPNVIDFHEDDVISVIRRELDSSFQRMGINQLNGYLLHTPEYVYNHKIMQGLQKIKDEGLVNNIGVSIYDLKEGEYAIETGVVDYIQLPYSYLDQRGVRSGFIKRAKAHGIKIFTRSAFLQGLVLMDKKKVPDYLKPAVENIEKFEMLTEQYNEDLISTVIHFVTEEEDIDYLVFGVDNLEQLKFNINAYKKKYSSAKLIEDIKKNITTLDENVIFPSLWSNGKKAK